MTPGACISGATTRRQTDLWTSTDGVTFQHHSTSIRASRINTRNATYSRVYDVPLKRYGSRYVMLYSGWSDERGVRSIWLATSDDAETWTQHPTPLASGSCCSIPTRARRCMAAFAAPRFTAMVSGSC